MTNSQSFPSWKPHGAPEVPGNLMGRRAVRTNCATNGVATRHTFQDGWPRQRRPICQPQGALPGEGKAQWMTSWRPMRRSWRGFSSRARTRSAASLPPGNARELSHHSSWSGAVADGKQADRYGSGSGGPRRRANWTELPGECMRRPAGFAISPSGWPCCRRCAGLAERPAGP